jgi:hypothetical protein
LRHRQGAENTTEEQQMFTNESVKAEVDYRRERLSRDFRHHRTTTRNRRHLVHLFGRKA